MYYILMIKVQNMWIPALTESKKLPLPIHIIVNIAYIGVLTLEEWVGEYKTLNNTNSELKFFALGDLCDSQ